MTTIAYAHPKNDDDFEILCLDLYRAEWDSKNMQRNGRRGHRQHGVDVFGHTSAGELRGIQCKLHEEPHELTEKEVREEVRKALGFQPALRHFVVATTSKRNPDLQRLARQLTEEHRPKGLFSVQVNSWDDLSELLQSYPQIAERLLNPALVATYQHQRDRVDQLFEMVQRTQQVDGHAEIDAALTHLRTSPMTTLAMLEQLRQRKWDSLDSRGRFRVLANMGNAASALDRVEEAARHFIAARSHQPSDDRAQALEALGYMYLGQRERAFELAGTTLRAYPMQTLAASVLVRSAPDAVSLDEILNMVPEALRKEPEVALALATRARLAANFKTALDLLSPALENEPLAEPVIEELARSTLAQMFGGPGAAPSSPLPPDESPLRELLLRINTCLEQVPADAFSRQARLLLLRSTAHERLGDVHASRADVARAFALAPDDENAVMQHALDEHEEGRAERAIEVLRKAKAPKTLLLLAQFLRQTGGQAALDEALTVLQSLEPVIRDQDHWLTRIWASELVLLYAELKRPDEGFALLDAVSGELLSASSRDALRAMLFRAKGDQASELTAIKAAFTQLSSNSPWDERRRVAVQLQAAGLFEEAFETWRIIVRPTSLPEDVENFLYCATKAERDRDVLRFCESAREHGLWSPELVRTELGLLAKYNSGEAALKLAREFLERGPKGEDGDEVRVHVALTSVRSGDVELAAELVNQCPTARRATPHVGRGIVEVLRGLDKLSEAATFAYDLVRANPQDIDAHRAVLASFGIGGVSPDLPQPSRAAAGVAVRFRENDTGREAWCVIEEELASRTDDELFGPAHPLSMSLMGKGVGDVFVLRKTTLQERQGTVLELIDKRVWRFRDSMEKWERRFPEDVTLQQFVLPEEGPVEVRLAPMFRAADLRAESQEQAFAMYRSGRVPIHLLAEVSGCGLFEATLATSSQPDLPVICCRGSKEERRDAIGHLLSAPSLVIDSTALATLFHTGTSDVLSALKAPLLVSEGTLNDLIATDVLTRPDGDSLARLGRVDGKYRLIEASPEQVAAMKSRLRKFIERVEATCEVVSGLPLTEVPPERREKLILLLGREQAETIAIAVRQGAVLWSDDFLASVVAAELMQCKRGWTQLVFDEELRAGNLSIEVYGRLVLGLCEAQYLYTWLSPDLFAAAGRECKWDLENHGFKRVLEHFADPNVNSSSLGILTLKTLAMLWSGAELEELAQAVTIRMGRNILKRPDGARLLEAVRRNLRKAFGLNALGEAKVETILVALRSIKSL